MGARRRRYDDLTPATAGGFRRTYAWANGVWLALGVAAIIGAATFLINPEALHDSSVGARAGALAAIWNAMYLVSGWLLVVGIMACGRPWAWRAELAGLWLFASSLLINALAFGVYRGLAAVPTIAIYVALAVASALRGRVIMLMMGASHR